MHAPPPLFVALRPSPYLIYTLLGIHALAGAALALSPLPLWSLPLSGLILVGSAYRLICLHGLRTAPGSIIRVQSRQDGSLECLTLDGEWRKARLLPESAVLPFVIVLCLKNQEGSCFSLTFMPDAVDAEVWRALRVWLRWARNEGGPKDRY